jgi:hypothetical protein
MAQAWVIAQGLGIMARQPTTSAPATRFFKNHLGGSRPNSLASDESEIQIPTALMSLPAAADPPSVFVACVS